MAPAKKKVLIVDDDSYILEIYQIALEAEGFKVLLAVSGQEGLQKAQEEKPDLVLLDVMMPAMDGFEMLMQLRQSNDYGKNVPVVMLTNMSAGGNTDVIDKIAETTPLYYIVKVSMTPGQVAEKIKEILK